MEKFLAVVLSCLIVLSLVGCTDGETVSVKVENDETLSNTVFGKSAMVKIGDQLYYDSTTRIVYWWNGGLNMGYYSSTTPSPYYAPNGLPYKYNPETNTFEEIPN